MHSFAGVMIAVLVLACAACNKDGAAGAAGGEEAKVLIAKVLDDWHAAAARADEAGYFSHFATEAVFLGTDSAERWDVPGFRAYARPHFARGKAWSFKPTRRAITVHPSAPVAWFDEDLATENLGPVRGSGVLVQEAGGWKIAQYNLAVTVPNARFKEVKALLESAAGTPVPR